MMAKAFAFEPGRVEQVFGSSIILCGAGGRNSAQTIMIRMEKKLKQLTAFIERLKRVDFDAKPPQM